MHELAAHIAEWQASDMPAWLVRPIDVVGFGARRDFDSMLVRSDGCIAGEILVRALSQRVADRVLATTTHADGLVEFDLSIHGSEASEVGLTCGGSLHLVVEPLRAVPKILVSELLARASVAFITRLDSRKPGTLIVDATGASTSTLGDALVDQQLIVAATDLLQRGRSVRHVEVAAGSRLLVDIYEPVPRVVLVGSGDLARALEAQVGLIGWSARTIAELPDALAAINSLDGSDAVIVLSHDPTADAPALAAALRGGVGYVGALGSRRTQAARAERLEACGVEARHRTALRGPVGLDIGASGSAETAVSIVAEIMAVRSGRSAQPLRDNNNPIHVTR